jgi:hypothetical protein
MSIFRAESDSRYAAHGGLRSILEPATRWPAGVQGSCSDKRLHAHRPDFTSASLKIPRASGAAAC